MTVTSTSSTGAIPGTDSDAPETVPTPAVLETEAELDAVGFDEEEEFVAVPAAAEGQQERRRSQDDVGFTLDEFASLLSKYDYNFKPGDVVNGTVFAMEPKGAMIDIGAKTAAFMPLQEVSINRVEGLSDVLAPGEVREFFIMSEENEDGQLALSIRRIEYQRAWERVRQLQKEDATIYSEVFATNRGGALVRVEGLRGFIPAATSAPARPKKNWWPTFCRSSSSKLTRSATAWCSAIAAPWSSAR